MATAAATRRKTETTRIPTSSLLGFRPPRPCAGVWASALILVGFPLAGNSPAAPRPLQGGDQVFHVARHAHGAIGSPGGPKEIRRRVLAHNRQPHACDAPTDQREHLPDEPANPLGGRSGVEGGPRKDPQSPRRT